MISKIQCWKASDGRVFETESAALFHERVELFHTWCRENICVGGEWSSDMVAAAILREWAVSKLEL